MRMRVKCVEICCWLKRTSDCRDTPKIVKSALNNLYFHIIDQNSSLVLATQSLYISLRFTRRPFSHPFLPPFTLHNKRVPALRIHICRAVDSQTSGDAESSAK